MSLNNNEITEEQLEQFTKSAVQAIHAQIDIPDPDESWKRMHVLLRKRNQRSRWLRASQLGIAIACISIVIGLFSVNPNPTYAFKQVVQIIKDTREGIVHILFGEREDIPNNGMLTPPPPDITGEQSIPTQTTTSAPVVSEPKQVSLEEASKLAKFKVHSPVWIPAGYQLDSIQLFPDTEGVYCILRIEYRNEATELISYMQKLIKESSSPMQTTVKDTAGVVKSVQLNDSEAVVIMYTHGGGHIEWLTPDMSTMLQITGNLTEEEMIKMANSTTKAEDY